MAFRSTTSSTATGPDVALQFQATSEAALRLVDAIRSALLAVADPASAPRMQAYMKSQMPYLGVRVPEVRKLAATELRSVGPLTVDDIAGAAWTLWSTATYREERYAATALLRSRQARGLIGLLPLHREMIVSGAWWDHVDEVAHRIGELLVDHPRDMRPVVLEFSRDPDMWLRRTSIICQLRRCSDTDLDLLCAVIEPNMADRDFFVRKAIGWALRDYAWTDPQWVQQFVDDHRSRLSPLSVREAIKNIR